MPNVGKIGMGEPNPVGSEEGNLEEGVSRVETYLDPLNMSDIIKFCGEEGRERTYDSLPVGRKAGNIRRATARESLLARATPVISSSYSLHAVEN